MKKIIFSMILSAMTAMSLAQVGIKAGIGFASVAEQGENYSRDDVEKKSILTPVLGLTFDLNLSDMLTIQPELLYAQSGGRSNYSLLGINNETTYRINYVEVPVLAKIKLGNKDQEGMGFYIAAGPWIGYAINGKYKNVTTSNGNILLEIDREYTFDDEDDTKRMNYGAIGAAGLSIGHATIDLRYNYGLNNLLDNDADNTNDDKPVLQTRGVALTLGYTF